MLLVKLRASQKVHWNISQLWRLDLLVADLLKDFANDFVKYLSNSSVSIAERKAKIDEYIKVQSFL